MEEMLETSQQVMLGLRQAADANLTPAIVFDRISDKPNESKSLEFQDAYAKRYVKDKGLHAVLHYSVTESGWSSKERRIFNRMLDIAETFGIRDLVFKNTDRLSRNLQDLIRIRELIDNKGYRIHFFENNKMIHQQSNYDEKWTIELLILLAKRLSDKLSHDAKASNKYKVEKSIAPGRARFGYLYDREKRKHVINPATEAEVRWIFDEFDSAQHSLTEFTILLNAKGIKNEQGRKWYQSRVYALLTNPFYHGEFITRNDGKLHLGNHDPYYSKERYLKRMEKFHGRYFPRAGKNHDFLLKGLLECSCGSKYVADRKKGRFVYYAHRCKHLAGKTERLNERAFFELIDAAISQIAITDQFSAFLKAAFKQRVKERNDNKREESLFLSNKILDLNRKKDRLLELFAEGGIEKDAIIAKLREYDQAIGQLKKQDKNLTISQEKFVFKVAEVIEDFKDFPQIYAQLSPEKKATLIRKSMRKITKDGASIRLGFKDGFQILYRNELSNLETSVRFHPVVCPRQESNLRTWLRRPTLYPLSYEGKFALRYAQSKFVNWCVITFRSIF